MKSNVHCLFQKEVRQTMEVSHSSLIWNDCNLQSKKFFKKELSFFTKWIVLSLSLSLSLSPHKIIQWLDYHTKE